MTVNDNVLTRWEKEQTSVFLRTVTIPAERTSISLSRYNGTHLQIPAEATKSSSSFSRELKLWRGDVRKSPPKKEDREANPTCPAENLSCLGP